jgi:hypothetical protein
LYEQVINSTVDASPIFRDETTSERFIKIVDSMSDEPCLRVRVYFQTGDEAYTPKLNNISVQYRVPILLEDQLNTPSLDIPGNDGVSFQDDRVRIIKVINSNPGLTTSTCQLGFGGISNSAPFTNADFEFININNDNIDEDVLQFDFPAFPAAPPDILSGTKLLCDDSNEIALYLEHQRSIGSSETIDLSINQDILDLGGPLNYRNFTLEILSP